MTYTLTINVWKQTKGKNKGNIKGPLFSALAGGKVGHIDLVLTAKADSETLQKLKTTYPHLKPTFSSTYETVKLTRSPDVEKQYKVDENFVEYCRGQKSFMLEFDHSFWPSHRPNITEEILGALNKKAGVKPKFNSSYGDMSAESPSIMINGKLKDPTIIHTKTKKRLKDSIVDLQNQLMIFEKENNKLKLTKNTLYCTIADLEAEKIEVESELKKLLERAILLDSAGDITVLNNENDDSDPVAILNQLIKNIDSELKTILQKSFIKYQLKLEKLLDELLINKSLYIDIQEKLLDNQEEIDKLDQKIEVLKNEINSSAKTEGKHPDFVINIPMEVTCKNSNDQYPATSSEYFLDPNMILNEMSRQRQDPKLRFSIYNNNCAVAVKNCILAGLSKEKRKEIKALGVSDKFFQTSLESPLTVMQWVLKLNSYIEEISLLNHQSNASTALKLG